MNTQRFHLTSSIVRQNAVRAIDAAVDGMVCEIKPRTRSLEQNARLHAMVSDIAHQVEFFGKKRDMETVKRLLVDAFSRVKAAYGEPLQGHGGVLPSLIGDGVVQLGIQTRQFSKSLMAEFIAYLHAWGVDNGVRFTDTVDAPEWYRDRSAA